MDYIIIMSIVLVFIGGIVALVNNAEKDDNKFKDYKDEILAIINKNKKLPTSLRNELDAMFMKLDVMTPKHNPERGSSKQRVEYEKLRSYYKGKFDIPFEINV